MKARTSIVFIFSLITFCAAAQSTKSDTEKFVGRWVSNDTGRPMEVNLKVDGTGVIDGDNAKWSVDKPGFISVTMNEETKTYNYVFNSEGFKVTGADLEQPLNFKKLSDTKSAAEKTKTANR